MIRCLQAGDSGGVIQFEAEVPRTWGGQGNQGRGVLLVDSEILRISCLDAQGQGEREVSAQEESLALPLPFCFIWSRSRADDVHQNW